MANTEYLNSEAGEVHQIGKNEYIANNYTLYFLYQYNYNH